MKGQLFLVVCVLLIILTDQGECFWRRRRRRRRPPPRVNCAVSSWGRWGHCNKPCNGGTQLRSRRITRHPRHGGHKCPVLVQWHRCNRHRCPCLVTHWGRWGGCSRTCDVGVQTRTRRVRRYGPRCPSLQHRRHCKLRSCPCQVSGWGRWGSCSRQCGRGRRYRSRRVTRRASPGGGRCPGLTQSSYCHIRSCRHCRVNTWSPWSACSKPCDAGRQTRSRRIIQRPGRGGRSCPTLAQSRSCNVQRCRCRVSAWGRWGSCNKLCGGGHQWRSRHVVRKPSPGGGRCPTLRHARRCNIGRCIHCSVTKWTGWGRCTKPCDGGRQKRSRKIIKSAGRGGRACPGLHQWRNCNTARCRCKVSAWRRWGSCSRLCGTGKQLRFRSVLRRPSPGGGTCPSLRQSRNCNRGACRHCKMSSWAKWGKCSKPCDTGKQIRTRKIIQDPGRGGRRCPSSRQWKYCNTGRCGCKVSTWTTWRACNATCGPGSQSRKRKVVRNPSPGGQRCPLLSQNRSCQIKPCPCRVSKWGIWSKCSKSCGMGSQTRDRRIIAKPTPGGMKCPPLGQLRGCRVKYCMIHCKVSKWGNWSKCSDKGRKFCFGYGSHHRIRRVIRRPAFGGRKCPSLKQIRSCKCKPTRFTFSLRGSGAFSFLV